MNTSTVALLFVSLAITTPPITARGCGSDQNLSSGRHLAQSSTGGCEVLDGVDFPNNSPINDGNLAVVDSAEECCELCKQTPGCATWVRIKVETRWNKKGACWLKDEVPEQTDCLVCEGGIIPEEERLSGLARSAVAEDCVVLPGMDFQGGDIDAENAPLMSSKEECCDMCKREPECKSWAHTKVGRCFIKDQVTSPNICPNCEAGGFLESRVTEEERPLLEGLLTLLRDSTTNEGLRSSIDGFLSRAKEVNKEDAG